MTNRIIHIAAAWIVAAGLGTAQAWSQAAPGQPPAPASIGDSNTQGVAAIVNDTLISDYDVNQRMTLFLVTSGIIQPDAEALAQIRQQVLRALEDETLQLQEASRLEITISPQEIDDTIAGIAGDNGMTSDSLTEIITNAGVTRQTFRRQIAANIAWNQLIQARYGGTITITEDQVNLALQRLEEGASNPQFQVSEIFLGIDNPQDEVRIREAAEQIAQQLQLGANFPNVARQFSQSASAASGGDIGWIQQGQLPAELDQALPALQPGGLTAPIRSEGGYYILLLRDRREPAGTEAVQAPEIDPDAPVPIDRFLLPLPAGVTDDVRNQAIAFAENIRANIRSCEDLPMIQEQTQRAVLMHLGEVNLNTLAPTISNAIRATPPGETVPPFYSPAGVELFVRCDERVRTVIPYVVPTAEELENQLFLQQINVLARSYLRDLRRDAVIETR